MNIREIVLAAFKERLIESGITSPPELKDDLVLLESGLDSLGFAVLVVQLEAELGYDPFVLMDMPVYPQTLGEFIKIYEDYKDYASE